MLLEINGTDCSGYLAEDARYSTDLEPVYALRYTDTDGVEHATILGWRSTLSDVQLRVLTNDQALALATILSAPSLSVKYLHGSLGIVTQSMILDDSILRGHLPANDGHYYWNGKTLKFRELGLTAVEAEEEEE